MNAFRLDGRPYGAPETLREVLMLNARLIVLVAILIVEVVYVVAVLR